MRDTVKLKDIKITAPKPLVERQLDKTVVNLDQHPTAEGETVLEALRHIPGVQVGPDGQITYNARAGVTVMIDGKPTWLSAQDLAALLSSMPAGSVQRLEFMTNPSAKFDAAGTGPLINIVRRRNRKDGFNGTAGASLLQGFYGRYNGNLGVSYKNGHVNLWAADSYTFNKILLTGHANNDFLDTHGALLTAYSSDNTDTRSNRFNRPGAGVDWYATPRTTLSLSATAGFGLVGQQPSSHMLQSDGQGRPVQYEDFSGSERNRDKNYATTLQWTQAFDTLGRNLTVDLDYANFGFWLNQDNRYLYYDTLHRLQGDTYQLLPQYRRLQIYSAQAAFTHPFSGGRWEAGLKSSYVHIVDTFPGSPSMNTEQIDAVYGTYEQSFKKLSLEAGLRVENEKAVGTEDTTIVQRYFQFFPSLFLRYAFTRQTLTLRLGRRTDRPDYSEMIPFRRPLSGILYFQGNANLRPDMTWHGELSWSWAGALTVTAAMDRDHDYMRTLPFADPGDSTITRRPTNIDAFSWNVDVSYDKQVTRWWTTSNTVSVFENGYSGNPDSASLPNPVAFDVSVDNTFQLTRGLTAEVDGDYAGKHRFIGSQYSAGWYVDAALRQALWKGRGSLSLNARRLLINRTGTGFDRYEGLYNYGYSINKDARTISLSLQYRFGRGKATHSPVKSGAEEERQRAGG